jgi:hypothetical protein
LLWYSIHSAEMLFSFMSAGCKLVRCIHDEDVDVVIGEPMDGRLGTMRGTRSDKGAFGCVVHTGRATRCARGAIVLCRLQ